MKSKLPPREQLKDEYKNGATYAKLAERYGCCIKSIWCRVQGVKASSKTKPETEKIKGRFDHISAMRAEGKSWREIGAALGITRQGAKDYHERRAKN